MSREMEQLRKVFEIAGIPEEKANEHLLKIALLAYREATGSDFSKEEDPLTMLNSENELQARLMAEKIKDVTGRYINSLLSNLDESKKSEIALLLEQ